MLRFFVFALISFNALADVETFCGKHTTANNRVFLAKGGQAVIVFGAPGIANQPMARQANRYISGGMRNGRKYCVNALLNAQADPYQIRGAYVDNGITKTFCGVRGGTAGNAWLESGDDMVTLATQGSDPAGQRGLELIDSFISGGTQNDSIYCVNGTKDSEGTLLTAIGAFEVP